MNIKIKTTRDRTTLWIRLVCWNRLIHVLCGRSWFYFWYSKKSISNAICNKSTKHQIFYLVTDDYYTLCVHFRKKARCYWSKRWICTSINSCVYTSIKLQKNWNIFFKKLSWLIKQTNWCPIYQSKCIEAIKHIDRKSIFFNTLNHSHFK